MPDYRIDPHLRHDFPRRSRSLWWLSRRWLFPSRSRSPLWYERRWSWRHRWRRLRRRLWTGQVRAGWWLNLHLPPLQVLLAILLGVALLEALLLVLAAQALLLHSGSTRLR